jgi:hypothetical protein
VLRSRESSGTPSWPGGSSDCTASAAIDELKAAIAREVNAPPNLRAKFPTSWFAVKDRLSEFMANPPEAWVPLPGHPLHAVRFQTLLRREEQGRTAEEVDLDDATREFRVAELLDGLGATRPQGGRTPERVFVSYSHRDETHKAVVVGYRAQLIQEGLITWWDDRHLRPADDWAVEIDRNLDAADVILLLTSKNFLASRYCTEVEVLRALHRRDAEGVKVIPVILDDSNLGGQPAVQGPPGPPDRRQADPEPAHWPDPNDDWRQVADKLRGLVAE